MNTYTWDEIRNSRSFPVEAGSMMCIDLGGNRGLYVEVLPRMADHDDSRICGRCKLKISYARAGRVMTNGQIVHITFDCTKD